MSSIGESLRRERRRRNLELDQISQELRISPRFLEAIEEEQFEKLPAGVFAKSFVRQYARFLGLDEDELAEEVQRVLEPPPPPVEAAAPRVAPIPDIHVPRVERWDMVGDVRRIDWSSWLPSLALVVLVMLVCSGVYAFWQRARRPAMAQTAPPTEVVQPAVVPQPQPAPPVETQPTGPAGESPAPSSDSAAPASEPAPQQQSAQVPTVNPPPVKSPPPATTSPAIHSADRPAPEALQPEAPRPGNPNGAVRLELTADEPVWVLARSGGKYLFSGTLEPHQTRAVEVKGSVLLRLGNAGSVKITLNGKPLGAIGPKGQVRDVQFTSGGFQIVAAPKPSLPLDKPI